MSTSFDSDSTEIEISKQNHKNTSNVSTSASDCFNLCVIPCGSGSIVVKITDCKDKENHITDSVNYKGNSKDSQNSQKHLDNVQKTS
ncbi:hypothetical protein TNCT_239891 [Trichonephila clavata]|uniref:Uncharacterized protein n=1 Tax=Trichonephila clavata TaxID=2740835 RepID=A0A8X6HSH1_TRICU|nr:hypothetical protein TNCT_239891 [Trichonephila clavata]